MVCCMYALMLHICRLSMTTIGSLKVPQALSQMGIPSPECASPALNVHIPPHYTVHLMSVASYVSTCTHVMSGVMTTAMVISANTFTVCIHYKERNLKALIKTSNFRKKCFIPRVTKEILQMKAGSCMHNALYYCRLCFHFHRL